MSIIYYGVGGVVLFIMAVVSIVMENMNRKHIRLGNIRKAPGEK